FWPSCCSKKEKAFFHSQLLTQQRIPNALTPGPFRCNLVRASGILTLMSLISLSNLEKSFGPRAVLKGLSLSVEDGDRMGLIGRNGCGKSTLLNILTGREEPDRGDVHMARDLQLAWLDQDPHLDAERTVIEEARTALSNLEELEAR